LAVPAGPVHLPSHPLTGGAGGGPERGGSMPVCPLEEVVRARSATGAPVGSACPITGASARPSLALNAGV
jgi:hypothetical protein